MIGRVYKAWWFVFHGKPITFCVIVHYTHKCVSAKGTPDVGGLSQETEKDAEHSDPDREL